MTTERDEKGRFIKGHTSIKYWSGKKRSPDTREKLRKASIGKKGYWTGKKLSAETRKKLSDSHKGLLVKEKHPQWKGGVSNTNKRISKGVDWRLWREAVFARDNWTCQKCNNRGKILHPHHIINFATHAELRFDVNNGVTLCEKCHNYFHKINGHSINNQKQLSEFLNK